MEGWSEDFNGFMAFILVVMFATLFWQSFQKEMARKNNPVSVAQEQQVQSDWATHCPDDYNPVCASDGLTYQNLCYVTLHKLSPQYMGACKTNSVQMIQQQMRSYSQNIYQPTYNNYPSYTQQPTQTTIQPTNDPRARYCSTNWYFVSGNECPANMYCDASVKADYLKNYMTGELVGLGSSDFAWLRNNCSVKPIGI